MSATQDEIAHELAYNAHAFNEWRSKGTEGDRELQSSRAREFMLNSPLRDSDVAALAMFSPDSQKIALEKFYRPLRSAFRKFPENFRAWGWTNFGEFEQEYDQILKRSRDEVERACRSRSEERWQAMSEESDDLDKRHWVTEDSKRGFDDLRKISEACFEGVNGPRGKLKIWLCRLAKLRDADPDAEQIGKLYDLGATRVLGIWRELADKFRVPLAGQLASDAREIARERAKRAWQKRKQSSAAPA